MVCTSRLTLYFKAKNEFKLLEFLWNLPNLCKAATANVSLGILSAHIADFSKAFDWDIPCAFTSNWYRPHCKYCSIEGDICCSATLHVNAFAHDACLAPTCKTRVSHTYRCQVSAAHSVIDSGFIRGVSNFFSQSYWGMSGGLHGTFIITHITVYASGLYNSIQKSCV